MVMRVAKNLQSLLVVILKPLLRPLLFVCAATLLPLDVADVQSVSQLPNIHRYRVDVKRQHYNNRTTERK